MIDETLSAAIRTIRDYTAARAWAAEILAMFALCTAGRFGLAVWLFDAALAGAGDAGLWWVAWLHAYDNLRAYAGSVSF